jgi:hypothetical protein
MAGIAKEIDTMITINQDDGTVTLINVFTCEPEAQQRLVDTLIQATEDILGKVPGIIYSALHRSGPASVLMPLSVRSSIWAMPSAWAFHAWSHVRGQTHGTVGCVSMICGARI